MLNLTSAAGEHCEQADKSKQQHICEIRCFFDFLSIKYSFAVNRTRKANLPETDPASALALSLSRSLCVYQTCNACVCPHARLRSKVKHARCVNTQLGRCAVARTAAGWD